MLCGAFSYTGTIDIDFLKGRQCSDDCQKRLELRLFLFGKLLDGV